ncbi:MAG: uridine kinase [Oscillospiraceae bacterium]
MKKIHISTINKKLRENEKDFIKNCETAYCSQIKAIADGIHRWGDSKPIILLSGPSGAGKTTTALKLREYLSELGTRTHTISMDDYFLPAHQSSHKAEENGEIDFESPYRLDIDLLNEHMLKIANCEEITLPEFNFKKQERSEGTKLKREKGDFVIFEGIHALNPDVTGMTDGIASGVYVSIRTRIQTKSGALLHPSHIRLMRRIIRDKFFRGRDPKDTLAMFANVERGENLYIMPYKQRAEYNIDTFIPYELSVYKSFLQADLLEASESYSDFERFALMPKVLEETVDADISAVPEKSLIREFIGGSGYEY